MNRRSRARRALALALLPALAGSGLALAQQTTPRKDPPPASERKSSFSPVVIEEPFEAVRQRMTGAKDGVMQRQRNLLAERYDLADRAGDGRMFRGKAVQDGVRAKLPPGVTWAQLATMTPEQVKQRGAFPLGFLPLPHPNHPEGGMLFPQFHIDAIKRDEQRDLQRFDLDFDLPDHLLPEFPAPMFLITRPDLGDVSQGKLVTLDNFFELFNGILNPKQLDGLRLLLTPFPQQQFNQTEDRRTVRPGRGVACLDCHSNGHTNASTHLIGDIRPQANRRRIDTPSLRGVNVQRLFGSQRALKTVEDFTEFEQRAAYFDGDPVIATKKGLSPLERGSQVHPMAEFQALLDFPPAPKLSVVDGKLDPRMATPAELRGQEVFFGKGRCSTCHTPPHYTDNTMHDLRLDRFYDAKTINGRLSVPEGPIKTFPLRGIKESPPYFNDGRLLTLDDAVAFFDLILETKLTEAERKDVVAFLKAL
jgi:cytochrome c peroxidase